MTTPQDIQAALDEFPKFWFNPDSGEVETYTDQAARWFSKNAKLLRVVLQSHAPEASAVDMDHVVFHLKAALSDIANGECAKGEIQWCIDELLRRGLLSSALL